MSVHGVKFWKQTRRDRRGTGGPLLGPLVGGEIQLLVDRGWGRIKV